MPPRDPIDDYYRNIVAWGENEAAPRRTFTPADIQDMTNIANAAIRLPEPPDYLYVNAPVLRGAFDEQIRNTTYTNIPRFIGRDEVPEVINTGRQYGITRQKTVTYELKIDHEAEFEDSIHDWFHSRLFENHTRIGSLWLRPMSPYTHCITDYSIYNVIQSKNPNLTLKDLLPYTLEQYTEYEIEHIVVEVHKNETADWRTKERYTELGFTPMTEDDYTVWMIFTFP